MNTFVFLGLGSVFLTTHRSASAQRRLFNYRFGSDGCWSFRAHRISTKINTKIYSCNTQLMNISIFCFPGALQVPPTINPLSTDVPCPTGMFRCSEGKCIPSSWVCNYQRDCEKGEDEFQLCRKFCMVLAKKKTTNLCAPELHNTTISEIY